MKWGAFALLMLSACAAPIPDKTQGFRDPDALIGATSRYEAAQFKGRWVVRGSFEADPPAQVQLVETTAGRAFQLCAEVGECKGADTLWLARELGQARYSLRRPDDAGARDLWVLWVDESFRTAVVGNPAGDFGWILDRRPTGGADRINAAREILDFNGYDISQLRMRK